MAYHSVLNQHCKGRHLLVIVLVTLGLGVITVFMHSIFNPYDEVGHFLYIQELAELEEFPSYLRTDIPTECVQQMALGVCPSADSCFYKRDQLRARNEISIHTPVYYLLAMPIYNVLRDNLCHALYGVRMLNVVLYTVVAVMAYLILSDVFSTKIALPAVLWLVTNPNLLARAGTATDDILPALWVVLAIRIIITTKNLSPFHALIVGGCAGTAFITKYTAYALVPVILVWYLYVIRKRHGQHIGYQAFLLLVGTCLPIGVQMILNYRLYEAPFFSDVQWPMSSLPRRLIANPFFEHPNWFIKWFILYWLDSWTSFYDWTSGYIYRGQQLYERYLLPMGIFYLFIGVVLFIGFVVSLSKTRKMRGASLWLLMMGIAGVLGKFMFDLILKAPYPAIRFGFPYIVGLLTLVIFSIHGLTKKEERVSLVLYLGVILNILQILVGLGRNIMAVA